MTITLLQQIPIKYLECMHIQLIYKPTLILDPLMAI